MSARKPVIIAVTVGALALAANAAVAVIAISAAASPPAAAAFAIVGLTAAFASLVTTIIWACREEAKPARPRDRVFTPWSEQEETPMLRAESPSRFALALARAPLPTLAPMPQPASEGRVIYIAEWLKARSLEHASA